MDGVPQHAAAFLTSAPAAESAAYRLDLGLPGTTNLGRVRLDGRDTLHVVRVEHTKRRRVTYPPSVRRFLPKGIPLPVEYIPAMTTRTEAWLDPLTYLPARVRTGDGRGHYSVTDERWLPRTPATLSRLRLRIPHAFRRLPVQQNGVDAWFTTLAVKRACPQS